MRRSAAACPSRLCCAPTSRSSRLCATRLAKPMRGSSAKTALSPNGRSRLRTAPGATWPTDAPSPSAQLRCLRCRSGAIVSLSTASNARSLSRRRKPTAPHRPHVSVLARRLSSTPYVARTRAVATRGSATFQRSRSRERRRAKPARPISASARCICCSRATEAGRAPIIPRIADSSTRCSSTCTTNSGLPRDEALTAVLASLAPQFAAASATQSCRVRGGVARQARGARSLERGLRPPSRGAAERPAHRGLPCLREIGRRVLAALRRFPGGRRWRSRPELAALATGSARRRPKGDRPCDRTQPPRL